MRRTILGAALLVCVMTLSAETAQAQVNPFRGTLTDLTPGDQAIAEKAGEPLRSTSAQVGDRATWSNPETGNSGSITVLNVFQVDNLPCQRIQHDLNFKERAHPAQFTIDRCQMPDGTWKMR